MFQMGSCGKETSIKRPLVKDDNHVSNLGSMLKINCDFPLKRGSLFWVYQEDCLKN